MPDRSRMAPISTNSGTASRVGSLTALYHRPGKVLSVLGSNTSNQSPRKLKTSAVAANENATL